MAIARGMREVAPQVRGDLLDLGCGLRPYESLFAPHIRSYIGVDYPPAGGDRSQIAADVYATSLRLPFRDGCVDTVLSTQVLEHVPEPLDMLRESHRVLRPGGQLILTAPFVWGEHETPRDFYRYTSFGLRHLLAQASFRVERVQPLEGLYAVLGQMLLDECNLTRPLQPRWRQRLLLGMNAVVNTACAFLDRRLPSTRLCLTYLVVAARARDDDSTCP